MCQVNFSKVFTGCKLIECDCGAQLLVTHNAQDTARAIDRHLKICNKSKTPQERNHAETMLYIQLTHETSQQTFRPTGCGGTINLGGTP